MPYRPTGVGGFGFSVNWEKVPGDKDVARRVVTFLEDRRLLFGERQGENTRYSVGSALEIRRFLTEELAVASRIDDEHPPHSRVQDEVAMAQTKGTNLEA